MTGPYSPAPSSTQFDPPAHSGVAAPDCWRVLVVDDDKDVHEATAFALKRTRILDRPLELIHAHDARQAIQMLQTTPDIAVVLLDIVMEHADTGLKLVEEIRANGFREQRIILRTGYPGMAPEKEIIHDYEVDDYWSKDELTRTRLVTSLTTAIRAYDFIRTLSGTRTGLEMVIEGTQHLYSNKSLDVFAKGVLTQLSAILRLSPQAGICALSGMKDPDSELAVMFGVGRFDAHVGKHISAVEDFDFDVMEKARKNDGRPVTVGNKIAFCHHSDTGRSLLIYLEHSGQIDPPDVVLLQVFANNLAICFDNLALITELGELAFVDQRLGMPNQNAFDREMQLIIKNQQKHALVAMVAIEDAAELAVAFGLSYFETLILAVYERLCEVVGKDVLVARVGEYTLGLVDGSGQCDLKAVEDIFEAPFMVSGNPVVVSSTIGAVRGNPDGRYASDIQRAARLTLLRQKQQGPGGTAEFKPSMADEVQDTVRLIGNLRDALNDRQVSFVFQPKVLIATGEVIGCEALCRWTNDGKPVSPAQFIPIAERAGLSADITFQCLDAIAAYRNILTDARLPLVPVAVNLAAHDIGNPDFIDQLLEACRLRNLAPGAVGFEITETQRFSSDGIATAGVQKLAAQGFEIWLDDFGTGYSSLRHLDLLPVRGIKIDKSFVFPLTDANVKGSVAASAAAIVGNLGLMATAEGIETDDQHRICAGLGVTIGQGFLYSPGLPAPEFVEWLKNWNVNGQVGNVAAK
ncbi:EAL domain-containing protein [Thalassospira sp. MA62]|nr:EAL domain-containing protein [Thalassospira sp. MA62]